MNLEPFHGCLRVPCALPQRGRMHWIGLPDFVRGIPGGKKSTVEPRLKVWGLSPGFHFETPFREISSRSYLGDGNSNIFYFHPEVWRNDPIGLIVFRWVETTN